jgi:hypothetical protein
MKNIVTAIGLTFLLSSPLAAQDFNGMMTLKDGDSILRINLGGKGDPSHRNMAKRIRRLERAVIELQNKVYDIQEQDIVKKPVYFCNDSEDLMTLEGDLVANFSFKSGCQRAKKEVTSGYFCNDNEDLIDTDSKLIARFSFQSECQRARKEILSQQ